MGEQKGSSSVVELDEEHMTIEIVDFAQDRRLFPEMHAPVAISNWSEQPTTSFDLFGFHLAHPDIVYWSSRSILRAEPPWEVHRRLLDGICGD